MADNHPIFVISDLHMGDGGARDNFPLDDREKQLEPVPRLCRRPARRTHHPGRPVRVLADEPEQDRHEAHAAAGSAGGDECHLRSRQSRRRPGRFHWHRVLASSPVPANVRAIRGQIGGKRFKFMHGHEVDPVNKGDEPGKGRIFCIVAGLFEDRNKSPVYPNGDYVEDDLERIGEGLLGPCTAFVSRICRLFHGGGLGMAAEHLTPAQNPDRPRKCSTSTGRTRKTNGYDVLIAGHTHQPGRIGNWYFNSGTWARKANSFVQISPAGDAAVFDWIDGSPESNNTVLTM